MARTAKMVTSMGMMVPQVAVAGVQVRKRPDPPGGAVHHDTGVLETQERNEQPIPAGMAIRTAEGMASKISCAGR